MAESLPSGSTAAFAPVYVEDQPGFFGDIGIEVTPDDPDCPKRFYFLSDDVRTRAEAILEEHRKHKQGAPTT